MKSERNPLSRSLVLLRHFIESQQDAIGVRSIAAALKMSPSTVHRLLAALTEEGLVERHADTGLYSLGLEMVRLSYLAVERLPIQKMATPYLEELVQATNESALLGLYDEARQELMYVASIESTQQLRHVIKLRTWTSVYAGACGLAIMAFLPEAAREQIIRRTRLQPLTDKTITERYKLEHALERVRRTGYACTVGQRTPGAVALAVPIVGPEGRVIGGVTITLPEQRFDRASESFLAEHVMRCAHAITRQLGGPVERDKQTAQPAGRGRINARKPRKDLQPGKSYRRTSGRFSAATRS
jgi:DNA-binding IclR family transcriptional regulator